MGYFPPLSNDHPQIRNALHKLKREQPDLYNRFAAFLINWFRENHDALPPEIRSKVVAFLFEDDKEQILDELEAWMIALSFRVNSFEQQ